MAFDMQTVLYVTNVTAFSDERLFRMAYATVSDQRRKKTDAFRFPSDKYLSLGAELLVIYGLRKAGIKDEEIRIFYTDNGKPYIPAENVCFSISHSGHYAVCAVSDVNIGCDVEKEKNADMEVAKRFFHPAEYRDIQKADCPAKQNELFYWYWTMKESFMKTTGFGMKLPLNSFRILREEIISVEQNTDTHNYYFSAFSDISGYKLAVCTAGEEKKIRLQWADVSEIVRELCPDGQV